MLAVREERVALLLTGNRNTATDLLNTRHHRQHQHQHLNRGLVYKESTGTIMSAVKIAVSTCVAVARNESSSDALDLVGPGFAPGKHGALDGLYGDELERALKRLQEL